MASQPRLDSPSKQPLESVNGLPQAPPEKMGFYRRRGKRLLDICVSAVGLTLLVPVFAMIAILVKLTSRGPVFYLQDRIGLGGANFKILKFRSMVDGADQVGPSITASGDRRVTRFGAILRKLKLDELPQLWNVLKGDMSLVGPRPELPVYVEQYTLAQRAVLSVRPGITDVASISYRHEEELLGQSPDPEAFYRKIVLNDKLALNLKYMERISLSFDTSLILMTLGSLFSSSHAQSTKGTPRKL